MLLTDRRLLAGIHPSRILFSLQAGPLSYVQCRTDQPLQLTGQSASPCYTCLWPASDMRVIRQSAAGGKEHTYSCSTTQILLLKPGGKIRLLPDSSRLSGQSSLCRLFFFQEQYLKNMLTSFHDLGNLVFPEQVMPLRTMFRSLARQLELEARQQLPGYQIAVRNLSAQLAILLVRNGCVRSYPAAITSKHAYLADRLPQIKQYIQQNCASRLTLAELAARTGVDAAHLGRCFKQQYGITIHEFRLQCRIMMACELLRQPYLRIGEIACRCGYQSASKFSRLFREKTGMRPIDYRYQQIRRLPGQVKLDNPSFELYDRINIRD